jgi:flagellar basal body-associated protein FliL
MNEKFIGILIIIGICIVCLAVGYIGANFFIGRNYNKQIERLSNTIATGQKLNDQLTADNKLLTERNTDAQNRIAELGQQIANDNKATQDRLTRIGNSIEKVGRELGHSGDSIQSVIDGLEQIKKILRTFATGK